MHVEEYIYRSATDLAEDIRAKRVSPSEVVEAAIDRIEARNGTLNAIIHKGYDTARTEAAAATEAIAKGDDVGPLHGVPVVMKDLFDFKPGWPTTMGGIPAMKDFVADFYSTWPQRMEAAGAIIVGKGNSPIMGFRGATDNPLFGATGNPFNPEFNSGGSSGGSAAAVADGMVPIAEGTDGGGSIRIPSAWCGTYGFQPSASRVPTVLRPNAFSGTSPFVYEGPITRTVQDAAIALNALSGPHAGDPFSLLDDPDFTDAPKRSIKGLRIAYTPDFGVYPVEEPITRLVEEAVEAFTEAGAEVTRIDFPLDIDQLVLAHLWCRLIMPLTLDANVNLQAAGVDLLGASRHEMPPELLYWADVVSEMSAMEYFNDNITRTKVFDAMTSVFTDHDLIVSPTVAAMPTRNRSDGLSKGPESINGIEVDPLIGWCMTYFTNFTGNPAASMPAGMADGFPVGLQVIGRRGADADVLAASGAFERVRPWDHIYDIPRSRISS